MRIARVRVSMQLFLDALAFPEGARVRACVGERAGLGDIDLFIEHDDLPEVPEGQEIPLRVPVITTEEPPPSDFFTFDWGEEVKP